MSDLEHDWDEEHSYEIEHAADALSGDWDAVSRADGGFTGAEVHRYMTDVVDAVTDAIEPQYSGSDSGFAPTNATEGELVWEDDDGEEYVSTSADQAEDFAELGYTVMDGEMELHGVEYDIGIGDEARSELKVTADYQSVPEGIPDTETVRVTVTGSEASHVVDAKEAVEGLDESEGLLDRIRSRLPERNPDFVY